MIIRFGHLALSHSMSVLAKSKDPLLGLLKLFEVSVAFIGQDE